MYHYEVQFVGYGKSFTKINLNNNGKEIEMKNESNSSIKDLLPEFSKLVTS